MVRGGTPLRKKTGRGGEVPPTPPPPLVRKGVVREGTILTSPTMTPGNPLPDTPRLQWFRHNTGRGGTPCHPPMVQGGVYPHPRFRAYHCPGSVQPGEMNSGYNISGGFWPFFTFTPPGPGFISRLFQQHRWGGGITLQRSVRCRFGSHFAPPDLSKNPECKPSLFLFFVLSSSWGDTVTQS